MPIKKEKVTKILNLNLKGIPKDKRDRAKRDVGEFVVNSILDRVGEGKSPVGKERTYFKKLNRDYAKREKGGDTLPNLELFGDMLDSLKFEDHKAGIEVGIFEEKQAPKAFNHNTVKSKSNPLPKRKFIPDPNGKFRRDIESGIRDILGEYRKHEPERRRDRKDAENNRPITEKEVRESTSTAIDADAILDSIIDFEII
jgi:hypothetical protein